MSTVKVVSLGRFAGGSFEAGGNPSKSYLMWAVRCPRNNGDTHKAGFVFRSEAAAKRFAAEEAAREDGARLERERQAKAAAARESRKADLMRGWDGYQFVGEERGRELAATL